MTSAHNKRVEALGLKTTAQIFKGLSATVPTSPTTSCCLHGFPAELAATTGEEYPYNKAAAFMLERVMHGILHNHAGTPFHIKAHDIYKQAYSHPEHGPNIKDINLMKSCIMMATELLQQSTGNDWVGGPTGTGTDMKLLVACELAAIIINIEVMQTPSDAALRKMAKDTNSLDCPRNMIRFFDDRNPCRCLDRLKALHGERLGGCQNPGCTAYGPDCKLLSCGGCGLVKYCSKQCQKADRPSHKWMCKEFAIKPAASKEKK